MDTKPCTPDPDRIVIFAESGLLAGDLAALLSGLFRVERVTSVPGAFLSLDHHPRALIFVEGLGVSANSRHAKLVEQCLVQGVGVLLLGGKALACPRSWASKVTFLKSMPHPTDLLRALKKPPDKEMKAEG